MTNMMLGDSTLECLTPSVNTPLYYLHTLSMIPYPLMLWRIGYHSGTSVNQLLVIHTPTELTHNKFPMDGALVRAGLHTLP